MLSTPLSFCCHLQHLCSCSCPPALLSRDPFYLQSTKTLQNAAKYSLGANNRTCRTHSTSGAVFCTSTFRTNRETPSSNSRCSMREDPHAQAAPHPPGPGCCLQSPRGEKNLMLMLQPTQSVPAQAQGQQDERLLCPASPQRWPPQASSFALSHERLNDSASLCSLVTARCSIGLLPPLRLQ